MALALLEDFVGSRRFEVARHLGSGGMGAVFEALDRERSERVAVKTLRVPSPEALLHLKNEFRALQDVRHENLVNLLELLEDDGRFFVTMELVEGCDLWSFVRPDANDGSAAGQTETQLVRHSTELAASPEHETAGPVSKVRGRFDEAKLRSALGQLALGLCALHERGKVHRDVKPANVIVTAQGRAVLVDFGLTSDLASEPTQLVARNGGTRAFMAPEQAAGQSVTAAADWYSFGVVLYLLLSGELPFHGAELERQKLRGAPRPIAELCAEAPEDLSRLALELLVPEPAARPAAAQILQTLGVAAAPPVALPLQAVPFVGREQELSYLLEACSRARTHATGALVIGDSGLGKSALVREALTRFAANDPEVLILAGRCYERELLPYKALDGIVDGLSHFLSEIEPDEAAQFLPENSWILTQIFPVLASVPGLPRAAEAPSDAQERRALAFAALREIFVRLSRERRVVLYIDDLQWADLDSHLLLTDLLRPPDAPAFCLLATTRPWRGDGADPTRTLTEQLADSRRLELSALPFDDARALASAVLGNAGEAALAPLIAKETGGHPLFVQALAAHAKWRGGLEGAAPRLEDALLAQVENVGAAARKLLDLTAVAGGPLATGVAARASALEGAAYSGALQSLRVARLLRAGAGDELGQIEPYHDRIREALLERLSAPERRRLHQSLADALESTGRAAVDPLRLVRHLEGAGRLELAAEQAELAAKHAERALAFDQAAELYATALRLGVFDRAKTHALRLALAEAFANAGRAVPAADTYLKAAAEAEPERALDYRRRAADHLLRSGHLERGTAILSDVLARMGDRWPSQPRALAATLFERLRARVRGSSWTARSEAELPAALLRRIDSYHAVGISFALIDPVRGALFEARALRLALDAGEPLRLGAVSVMEACYEASSGRRGMENAARLAQQVERVAAITQSPYIAAVRGVMQGFIAYHAGEFTAAARMLEQTEQTLLALPGTYFEQAFCHCFRLICLRNSGQLGELSRGYFEWVRKAERRGDRFTATSLRFNLNGVWLARDQPDEALLDLTRVMWMPPRGGYHVQHWYEQQARAEIALYAGSVGEGLARFRRELRALSRSFILRMRLHRAHATWIFGRLLLANALRAPQPATMLDEADRAARKLWSEDIGYSRAWSLLIAAAVQHLRRETALAKATLRRAISEAARHGLAQCEHAATYRLGQLLGGDEGEHYVRQALIWGKAEQIVNPERLLSSWAPGFD